MLTAIASASEAKLITSSDSKAHTLGKLINPEEENIDSYLEQVELHPVAILLLGVLF